MKINIKSNFNNYISHIYIFKKYSSKKNRFICKYKYIHTHTHIYIHTYLHQYIYIYTAMPGLCLEPQPRQAAHHHHHHQTLIKDLQ